ncbi:hypothetical protein VOLCADRAFT_88632 [Volvox carteri f. nagariensis]|uniref:Uncharacterized protein n=1 Tax=Volvox carteri f. nagariensis TaxID=3068 RepID=D8TPI7_VOLCA|nr:uncharacterized protein VOLCADRAFT_88632 [Volvox carteri f. nagariensis]EFJ50622.1 hypothetical protein VOLCADRAFT_88632 [Volvox carteri f. nagariensis]|eukprot:XP_002948215.1 hypothetical protein VOLCADRAFT_88632 [Volvox carteri f. nagariensis]
MLPTAHFHHHHHHFQPLGSTKPSDPQWQAHPHVHSHVRSAGRGVDLGPADSFPSELQPAPADDDSANAYGGAAADSIPSGPYDISPAGAAFRGTAGSRMKQRLGSAIEPSPGTAAPMTIGSGMYGGGGGGGSRAGGGGSIYSYTGATGAGVSGGAARHPKLRNLQWLWSVIVWYWSTVAWVVTLPWRVITWLSPGALRPAEQWLEQTVEWWTGPPRRLAANLLYGVIAWCDGQISYLRRTVLITHKTNLHHFWVAYEAYLRLIQHKAHLIEQHGFDGLWMALNIKTV